MYTVYNVFYIDEKVNKTAALDFSGNVKESVADEKQMKEYIMENKVELEKASEAISSFLNSKYMLEIPGLSRCM